VRGGAAALLRGAALGVPRLALSIPPRARRRLAVGAAALAALALAYYGWFRDSSLVRVREVSVAGLTGDGAPELRARLTEAARGMTTLHVREEVLARAVAGEPTIRAIEVRTDFPHGLRINVVENVPAAILDAGGHRVAVSGNGRLLRGVRVRGALPEIRTGVLPARDRLAAGRALRLVSVAGAAPAPLRGRTSSVYERSGKEIVARLRNGPEILFGDATRLRAKWAAAAAILADSSSRGATHVDVRIPERPVAAGLDLPTTEAQPPAGSQSGVGGAAPQAGAGLGDTQPPPGPQAATGSPTAPGAPAAPGSQAAPGSPAAPAGTAGGTGNSQP
jgi:cell division protein FtsQ